MARAESEQSRKVITDKEVICNIGTARYRLATALNNQYSISNDFYYEYNFYYFYYAVKRTFQLQLILLIRETRPLLHTRDLLMSGER